MGTIARNLYMYIVILRFPFSGQTCFQTAGSRVRFSLLSQVCIKKQKTHAVAGILTDHWELRRRHTPPEQKDSIASIHFPH